MSDGWYGPAIDNHAPRDAGDHLGPVTIGVLHTTESPRGSFRARKDNYFGHQSYPHFTCDVQDGKFKVWQHISIRKAAKALENDSGGVQTNKEGCIQIEVVGRASAPFTSSKVMVEGLKKLMRWIEANTEIPSTCGVIFHPYPPDQGAQLGREPWRYSRGGTGWTRYKGWLGHQHVPENAHGDPGAIDISKLLAAPAPEPVKPEPPTPTPTTQEIEVQFIFTDPRDKKQYMTDLVHKRHIGTLAEHSDLTDPAGAGPYIKRINLDDATIDAIPTVKA